MEDIKKINIALLGAGTVGSGVYKLIQAQKEELPHKVGAQMEITRVLVRDKTKPRPGIDPSVLTDDWQEIISDPSIQIIVEVMGGIEPARSYILAALDAGKHVVTANKDLMASDGKEIMDAASHSHCDLLFEAAVAGGIPIIRPLKQCLAGNHITEVMGIINGTTNFILSKMAQEGMEFSEALAQATELGYAEADPTADIEGYDAGRKIAIMASIAFNSRVTFNDVYTEGISKISAKDIRYAKDLGCTIKLLGVARNTPEGIEARVHPMLIPSSHPLASVSDAFNAVFVHGDAVDDTMFYGRGAGELPTASAVMGDIIDVARNIQFHCNGRISCTCYKNLPIKTIDQIQSSYFLRLQVDDRPGVLAGIASVFGNNNVSINRLVQNPYTDPSVPAGTAEVVVITHNVTEKDFKHALTTLEKSSYIHEISTVIRVYAN